MIRRLLLGIISMLIISIGINVYLCIVLRSITKENIVSVDHFVMGEEHTGDTTNAINLDYDPVLKSVVAIRNGVTLPISKFNVKGNTVTVEGIRFASDVFQFNYLIKK